MIVAGLSLRGNMWSTPSSRRSGGPTGERISLIEGRADVCRTLKDKCLSAGVKAIVGDRGDLDEVWYTVDPCYNRLEKYIAEALDPIVKFRKYKSCEHVAEGNYIPC
jgi:hypothetical protein